MRDKIALTVRLLALMGTFCVAWRVWADEWTDQDTGYTWTYQVSGETAVIYKSNYSCAVSPAPTGVLTIPSTIEGYTVRSIESCAFYGCSGLTSVTIPGSVTSIGYMAFAYCSGLASVAIPNSVTSIGHWAFAYCNGLTSVTIPGSVTSIGEYAFLNCSGLTSVTIPGSVTSIGDRAFSGCSGLTGFVVLESNPSYKSDLGLLLTKDGTTLIAGTNGDVAIPNGVTSIGYMAFAGCSGLTSVTIPDSVTSIGPGAFGYCTGLTSVTIPGSVTSIGSSAFYNCSGLTSVHISDIGAWCKIAFGGSSANPLYYAHNLYLSGGLVTDVTIPASVTSIGDYAFQGCSGLTSVTIPGSVMSIGNQAFYGCSGLTSVVMQGDAPGSIGSSAFSAVASECKVRIPRGNDTYSVTDGKWQGMTVEYYDLEPELPVIAIDDTKMEAPEDAGDGARTITLKVDPIENESEIAALVESVTISVTVGAEVVDTTSGYNKAYDPAENKIVITLKEPEVGAAATTAEETKVVGDATGMLADVPVEELSTEEPTPSEDEEAAGTTEVGALPVKAVKGLYYQAAWGSDLGGMRQGEKVQATGDKLYLGVIKQQATQGFYKVTVSEQ